MPIYGYGFIISDWFSRLIKNPPIRAKGTVADLNVYLMKVRSIGLNLQEAI